MSLSQRADKSWRARFTWTDEANKRRETTKVFPEGEKGKAKDWLVEQAVAFRTGSWVDPKKGATTLAEFYADWSKRQVWADTTLVAMNLAIAKCSFKDVEFSKLRRSHVEQWVKSMDTGEKKLAASTIKTRVNNVRSALRAAVRDRLLPSDPSDGVTLPRRRRAVEAMVIPPLEDVAAVIAAAEPWFRTYVRLCAFAGLRLGEASGIQVGDIEFLKRRLTVVRQIQRAEKHNVTVSPPKYGSERKVFIPDALTEALAWHIENVGVRGDEGWLFVGDQGLPPHGNTIHYWWTKTLRDAGVKPFTLHTLRHFYASGLIASGCDVVTVQRAVGHHSATVTLSTYSHLWPTAEDRTRLAAADLMRSVGTFEAPMRHQEPESR